MKDLLKDKRALIAITTCNRFGYFKRFIWDYVFFVEGAPDFELVVSLDGYNEEYVEFCNRYGISIIYSEVREGVGLSKNRVLNSFPNFQFYFFIEDDVELIDEQIFNLSIGTLNELKVHHLCGNENHKAESLSLKENDVLNCSWFGGGYFSVYSKKGIETVGGWDTRFVKYKRFGHTEHSYRFVSSGLQSYPFIFPDAANSCILLHSPPSVTATSSSLVFDENGLIQEETDLIRSQISFQEVLTICQYNKIVYNEFKIPEGYRGKKYPVSRGLERRLAFAEHYALCIPKTNGLLQKIILFLKSIMYYPTNVALKHVIKTRLKLNVRK